MASPRLHRHPRRPLRAVSSPLPWPLLVVVGGPCSSLPPVVLSDEAEKFHAAEFLTRFYGITWGYGGRRVAAVHPEGPAALLGVRVGMVAKEVAGRDVSSLSFEDFVSFLTTQAAPPVSIRFLVPGEGNNPPSAGQGREEPFPNFPRFA